MKKQIVQTLWHIASGKPQEQGEKVVYPNIREQLNAIKALMSIDGWDELDPKRICPPQRLPLVPLSQVVKRPQVTSKQQLLKRKKLVNHKSLQRKRFPKSVML